MLIELIAQLKASLRNKDEKNGIGDKTQSFAFVTDPINY